MITEKYRPKTPDEWIGVSSPVNQVIRHVGNMLNGKPVFRCILLFGKPGTGKTTLAYLVAKHFDIDIIEINASDERNSEDVNRIWKQSSTTNLNGKKNLILLDEFDGFNQSMQSKIAKVIGMTATPIIICANDESKISYDIKNQCLVIKFDTPSIGNIMELLTNVARKEGLTVPRTIIMRIASMSSDYRSALNKLFYYAIDENINGIDIDSPAGLITEQIEALLDGNPPDSFGAEPSLVMRFLFENSNDVDLIVDSDVFLQHSKLDYRFWRYSYEILKQCRNNRNAKLRFPKSMKPRSLHNNHKKQQKQKPGQSKQKDDVPLKNSITKKKVMSNSKTHSLSEFF